MEEVLGPWGGSEECGEGGNVGVCLWVVVGNSSGEEGDSRGCDAF